MYRRWSSTFTSKGIFTTQRECRAPTQTRVTLIAQLLLPCKAMLLYTCMYIVYMHIMWLRIYVEFIFFASYSLITSTKL